MNSQTTYASTVNSFYLAFYGRPADPAGLAFWAEQLANNDGNLSAITQAFATSEEAQVRFGTDTVTERISEIYQALFNRAPDTVGLAYWTSVVAQGNASMADVSVAIMNGAQGIDKSLTALRQTAVDAFTAQVEASGSQYSGYASVEAARILVRAITVDTATGDVDTLVKAAVSFADTATRTPSVVDAIATGTTLLALFDTARGKGDPVALAQALADTAKAAAGNPATLDSLLRGGGMDQVLKVMPANATLKDVVAALAAGGLPAAIEVVYPTAPSTPAPTPSIGMTLSFKTVDQDLLDKHDDNVTNQSQADVTFSYRGRDLSEGQHFQYKLGEMDWVNDGITVDAQTNTVVLNDVNLIQLIGRGILPQSEVMITLRTVDANGNATATTPLTQSIFFDGYVMNPTVALKADSFHGKLGSDDDMLTNDPALEITNLEAGATVDYQIVYPQDVNSFTTSDAEETWTTAPVYQQGENTVRVRVTDVAGNQNSRDFTFTLDSVAPDAPTLEVLADTGTSSSDKVTSDGAVRVSGLATDAVTAWEYSLDSGKSWIYGGQGDESGVATLDLGANDAADGIKKMIVRQYDQAGNISGKSDTLTFELDTTAPANTLAFLSVSGSTGKGSTITVDDQAAVTFSYDGTLEQGSYVEYNVGGKWRTLPENGYGNGTVTIDGVVMTTSDPTVSVRIVDVAGNATDTTSVEIDGPYSDDIVTASYDFNSNSVGISSTVAGDLYLTADGDDFRVSINGEPGVIGGGGAVVGVQTEAIMGVVKVAVSPTKSVLDTSGVIVALGTVDGDTGLTGSIVLGFGGDDELTGTSGMDFLDGGAGADTIFGGKGGDIIFVTNNDTLKYSDGGDSNLSAASEGQLGMMQSFDIIVVSSPSDVVKFEFPSLLSSLFAHNANTVLSGDLATQLAQIQSAFDLDRTPGDDAMLFNTNDSNFQVLVVDDGDDIIGESDLVILIGSPDNNVVDGYLWTNNGVLYYGAAT